MEGLGGRYPRNTWNKRKHCNSLQSVFVAWLIALDAFFWSHDVRRQPVCKLFSNFMFTISFIGSIWTVLRIRRSKSLVSINFVFNLELGIYLHTKYLWMKKKLIIQLVILNDHGRRVENYMLLIFEFVLQTRITTRFIQNFHWSYLIFEEKVVWPVQGFESPPA